MNIRFEARTAYHHLAEVQNSLCSVFDIGNVVSDQAALRGMLKFLIQVPSVLKEEHTDQSLRCLLNPGSPLSRGADPSREQDSGD